MTSIMVIEDNNELLHYLCMVLRSAGHKVIGVSSSQKGVEAAIEHDFAFDLLLLDVQLGDATAFEFLDKVKAQNPVFNPKICFISSRRDSDTVKRAVSMGAGDYIVKPVLSGTLLEKITKLMGNNSGGERYSSATCSFKAQLHKIEAIQPDLLATDVSETGVVVTSSVLFLEGAVVSLVINELQQVLDHKEDHIIFRVNKCRKQSWGKYQAELEFVGLGEEKVTKLRSFTIRGGFLAAPAHKKPA